MAEKIDASTRQGYRDTGGYGLSRVWKPYKMFGVQQAPSISGSWLNVKGRAPGKDDVYIGKTFYINPTKAKKTYSASDGRQVDTYVKKSTYDAWQKEQDSLNKRNQNITQARTRDSSLLAQRRQAEQMRQESQAMEMRSNRNRRAALASLLGSNGESVG